MAIAFGTTSFAVTSGGADEVTCNKPTSTAEDDLLVAFLLKDDDAGTIAVPSGWTALHATVDESAGAQDAQYRAFYKVAGASEPSTYTFTWTGDTEEGSIRIVRITGAETTGIPDSFATDNTQENENSPAAPAITTVAADTLQICIWAQDENGEGTGGTPSGFTEIGTGAEVQNGEEFFNTAYRINSSTGLKSAVTWTDAFTGGPDTITASYAFEEAAADNVFPDAYMPSAPPSPPVAKMPVGY